MKQLLRQLAGKPAYPFDKLRTQRPGVVGRWFYVALAEANMFERGPLGLRLVGG